MTAAANGRPKRFDLDGAAAAALAEANPQPFAFTFKGQDFDVPAATTWPLEAQAMIARGDLDQALTLLLGAEPYARLVATGMTVGELTVLFEAIGDAAGVGGLPNLSRPAAAGSTPT